MTWRRFIGIGTILAGLWTSLPADQLVFENGDRLTGDYVATEDGEVIFESPLLGEIQVPSEEVEVVLDSPGELAGADEPDESAYEPDESAEPVPAPPAGATAVRAEPPGVRPLFPRWNRFWEDNIFFETLGRIYPLMAWENKIELGFNMDFGESDTRTTVIRFQTGREVRKWDFYFESSYEYAQTTNSEGVQTRSTDRLQGRVRVRRDVDESKAFFVQSNTRYNRDLVSRIYNEVEETLGMGYRWLNTSRWKSSIVASVGGGYREIEEEPGRFGFVSSLNQDMSYRLSEGVTLKEEGSLSYVPTSENDNAYLFTVRAAVESRLNAQLSLNLRYEYRFDERVTNPSARTRQSINLSLGADF